MSTFYNVPIYDQGKRDWAVLGRVLAARREATDVEYHRRPPGLEGGRACLGVRTYDSVVVMDECVEDVKSALGEDAVEVVEIKGRHEVAISKGRMNAEEIVRFWKTA
jgi:hypothetical protein